ncbi:MAG: ABC transporter substrate-binding protein [Bacteroidales bacterium]|nr:ABC transporter substrate-binding protein [Candidatus Colimorpha onthohippi]
MNCNLFKFVLLLIAAMVLSQSVWSQKVVFVPQFTAQSQFAGYYVALQKGFYKDEGLDVEIRHIGASSSQNSIDLLVEGKAHFAGAQLMQGIVARSKGVKLVNVLQLSQRSSLCCVAHFPVGDPEKFKGKKIGRWHKGFSEPCLILDKVANLGIQWVDYNSGIGLFTHHAVDASLMTSFSELIALRMSVGEFPDTNIYRFADKGFDVPEDAIFVDETYYKNNKAVVDKFVRATKRGWEYTRQHQDEALDITMAYMKANHVVSNRTMQRMMLEEVLRLQVNKETNKPDYKPYPKERFKNLSGIMVSAGVMPRLFDYEDLMVGGARKQ